MRQVLNPIVLTLIMLATLPVAARISNLTATCTRISNMNQAGTVRTDTREMKFRINFQASSTRIELLFADNNLDEVLLSNEAAAIRGHDDRSEFIAGSSVMNVGNSRETSNVTISENHLVATLRMEYTTPRGREVQAQDIRCRLNESQWEEISGAHSATVAGDAVPFHNGASSPALFAELRR